MKNSSLYITAFFVFVACASTSGTELKKPSVFKIVNSETRTFETGNAESTRLGAEAIRSAMPAAPKGIPNRSLNVTVYGATPNDARDDTVAIQATIDAVSGLGGGTVLFPAGQFDVSIQAITADRPHPQALVLRSKLRLTSLDAKQPAVIRLANAQGNYESMLATAQYATPLEDDVLENLVIDGNGQNNPVVRGEVRDPCCSNSPDFGDNATQTPRYAVRAFLGKRVRIDRVRFINQTNVNVISFNGSKMSDAEIKNSVFASVGSESVDFDHSSIYTAGPRMRVANNRFVSRRGAGTPGARTAIETHSTDQIVEGNVIDGFFAGINVVAEGAQGGVRQVYRNNTIKNVNTGFLLWSFQSAQATTSGLQNILISGNTIGLNNRDWLKSKLASSEDRAAGVAIEGSSDAEIQNLEISDNSIDFAAVDSLNPNRDQFCNGITLWAYKVPNLKITNLTVKNNRITRALGAGIRSDVAVTGGTNRIEANTIIGAVQTDQLNFSDLTARQLRSGIYVANQNQNLTVKGNSISLEAGRSSAMQFGITAVSKCLGNCVIQANAVSVPGASTNSIDSTWTIK